MADLTQKSCVKVFGGWLKKYSFASTTTQCDMTFQIFFPETSEGKAVPLILFLGGLTCNEDNFFQKAGAFQALSRHGIACVSPDTSPRVDVEGDSDSWDLGKGASYYVDATEEPWNKHYRMYNLKCLTVCSNVRCSSLANPAPAR